MGERILVVDDEAILRRNVVKVLQSLGHTVDSADSGEAALERLADHDYGLVITDLRMPGLSGIELLEHIVGSHPQTMVLIVTAYASLESALGALRLGAQDYLLKPLSLEEVTRKVSALIRHRELELRVRRLREEVHAHFDTDGIVAASPAMAAVMRMLEKVAASSSTVLIEGESGTGKELLARAVHDGSPRADLDFIAVNLAAQPAELVDAMLFGHDRGAYTGATRSRAGVFRAARGGTVFIDEVGDLPADVQVKLLRVIENREVQPLGSDRPVAVDFRLVVATHRRLERLVEEGTFREDLFFRLNVVRLEVPPLRHRAEDLAPLAARLLARHAGSLGRPAPRLTNDALRLLGTWAWPGNVRELSNVLERAVLLTEGEWVTPDDLPAPRGAAVPLNLKDALEDFTRGHIARVLASTGGDKGEAARILGIHLATLYRHLERLDVA